jgi:hypothetical protein
MTWRKARFRLFRYNSGYDRVAPTFPRLVGKRFPFPGEPRPREPGSPSAIAGAACATTSPSINCPAQAVLGFPPPLQRFKRTPVYIKDASPLPRNTRFSSSEKPARPEQTITPRLSKGTPATTSPPFSNRNFRRNRAQAPMGGVPRRHACASWHCFIRLGNKKNAAGDVSSADGMEEEFRLRSRRGSLLSLSAAPEVWLQSCTSASWTTSIITVPCLAIGACSRHYTFQGLLPR